MRGSKWPAAVVIAVTCMLAAQALACGFSKYQCRSKQSEAQVDLAMGAASMEAHRAEHAVYAKDMAGLEAAGFAPQRKFYDYVLTGAKDDSFLLEAVGKGDMSGDRWSIDESGITTHVSDVCP